MKENARPLQPLTSFRFLAALAVFCHHVPQLFNERPGLARLYQRYFYEGYAGVTFFFVLSGFILTYNYHGIFTSLKMRDIWKFYVARLARIYPLHLLSFVVVLPMVLGSWTLVFSPRVQELCNLKALANLTLTQSFVRTTDYYFSFNAPSWSLSDECFFYAALPVLLWLLAALRLRRPVAAALIAVALASFALCYTWVNRAHPFSHWRCYINPLYRLADFTMGVSLCLVFLGWQSRGPARAGKWLATVLELASLAALGAAVAWAAHVPFPVRLGAYYTPFMGAVILVFAFQRGYLSRLLSARVFLILGEISFAFYMFHTIVIYYLNAYSTFLLPGRRGPLTRMGIALATTVVVSWLCHYAYERPMRESVKRLLQGRRKDRLVPLPEVVTLAEDRARAA